MKVCILVFKVSFFFDTNITAITNMDQTSSILSAKSRAAVFMRALPHNAQACKPKGRRALRNLEPQKSGKQAGSIVRTRTLTQERMRPKAGMPCTHIRSCEFHALLQVSKVSRGCLVMRGIVKFSRNRRGLPCQGRLGRRVRLAANGTAPGASPLLSRFYSKNHLEWSMCCQVKASYQLQGPNVFFAVARSASGVRINHPVPPLRFSEH